MEFQKTPLEGAFVVNVKKLEDERGYFGRVFCEDEFRDHDLAPERTSLKVPCVVCTTRTILIRKRSLFVALEALCLMSFLI